MINEIKSLPTDVITAIKEFVLQNNLNTDNLLRDEIFSVLEQYCTVLYYPQENEENDGCHIKRLVNDKIVNFVFINTHKSIEKQVFTAAHELGHILNLSDFFSRKSKQKLFSFSVSKCKILFIRGFLRFAVLLKTFYPIQTSFSLCLLRQSTTFDYNSFYS